ncbi:hypothetical protein BOX15_Mlig007423g1 [Macrostomum lignano]|nr:hypothetical protein BOX15_Mlig007423g1 [Macrostomum lignano]
MSLQNVSIVLSPTMQISHKVLHVFFSHLDELFSGVVIKRYVAPLRPQARMEIPETLEDVEAELAKQESLLEWLHQELSALKSDGLDSQDKSNLIWEVQRVVTALKRKKSLIEMDDIEAIESELLKQETSLNRLHATLTGCPTDDQETQDQLWEVQRTITMLKRKLRKTAGAPRPSLPGGPASGATASVAGAGSIRGSASADHVNSAAGGIAKSPSFPTPGSGIRPDMTALEENLELNLALRRVNVQVHQPSGTAETPQLPQAPEQVQQTQPSSVQQPLPQPQSQQPQTLPQPQPQQQPPPQPSPPEPPQEPPQPYEAPPPEPGPLNRLDSLRESSRCGDSSIADTDTDVELYALTRNPPPLELQEDEPDESGTEEGDGEYEEDEAEEEEEEADDDDGQARQDLDQLAYRLEEEENQLLCASEVEEETADLLAVVEDLRRLRLEEEELAQLSDELGMRVARERQEMDRLRAEIDRWANRDQRPAGGPDNCPDTSSSASSDSEDESDSALLEQWHFFREDNHRLVKENADLAERLQKERMLCAEYRVQLRVQAAYGPLISIGL